MWLDKTWAADLYLIYIHSSRRREFVYQIQITTLLLFSIVLITYISSIGGGGGGGGRGSNNIYNQSIFNQELRHNNDVFFNRVLHK
jgi:hypothetical protein